MAETSSSIFGLTLTCWWGYGLLALLGALIIRVYYGWMGVLHPTAFGTYNYGRHDKRKRFLRVFGWFSGPLNKLKNDPKPPDEWTGFWLGAVQLVFFPFLLKASAWTIIAGWIAAQLAVGWREWKKDSESYNRTKVGRTYSGQEEAPLEIGGNDDLRIRFNSFLVATAIVMGMAAALAHFFVGSSTAPDPRVRIENWIQQGRSLGGDTITITAPEIGPRLDSIAIAIREVRPIPSTALHLDWWLWAILLLGLGVVALMLWRRAPVAPALLATSIVLLLARQVSFSLGTEVKVEPPAPGPPTNTLSVEEKHRLGPTVVLGPFATAWDTLERPNTLRDFVAGTADIRRCATHDSLFEVVVDGRVDQRQLVGMAHRRFGGNETLAIARAHRAVLELCRGLSATDSSALSHKIRLHGGGADHHGIDLPQDTLAADRCVRVRATWITGNTKMTEEQEVKKMNCCAWMPCALQWLAFLSALAALVAQVAEVVKGWGRSGMKEQERALDKK